ncbi:TonB-dependent receptor [Arcicella sp. LKC2W]|uniref:TonB-dependent receptor n=1 Tax=Arcicella sp. LKC2W TaxID=2984198 RepID=UPI002B20D527|nr:TonB-dependent receptor [Arcicella sp. LKC2W]MEA5458390.1 TonB-dependent receptor [Arcicella sp. LKC2W]
MKKTIIIITLFFSAWLSTFAQRTSCTCSLKGVVHEKDIHQAVAGAVIYIKGTNISTFADGNGRYGFKNLCQGQYTLICQAVGFQKVELIVNLTQEHNEDFSLEDRDEHLQEVVVAGKKIETITQTRTTLDGQALEQTRGQSLGESLKAITGVTSLQTGSSISKPIIHGMHSNRVLILNNGIRQEGQQWGSEHAPEIDPFVAKKLTVVKGAAGVRYGSDAIAGVIMVEPDPLPDSAHIHGEINAVGLSNGRVGVFSGIIEGGLPKIQGLAWRLQGTYKRGGDIKTADYYMLNTGVQERNFSVAIGYKKQHFGTELFFSYFDTQLGIFTGSHIGNLTDLQNAIQNTKPNEIYTPAESSYDINRPNQDLAHNLFKIKSFAITENLGKWTLTLSRQYDWRLEYDAPRGNRTLNTLNFKLTTYTGELLLDHKPIFKNISGSIGLSGLYQENLSSAYELRKPLINTVLIPNYQVVSGGVFLIERYLRQKWEFETGLRYDFRNAQAFGLSPSGVYFDNSFNFGNFSATLGANYTVNDALSFKFNVANAWRSPNMNELFSDGVHHGAAAYEKGNINLKPEVAHNFSLTSNFEKEKIAIELTAYLNYINDFIYLRPRIENGIPQTVLTVRGAFPAFDYTQVDARFAGLDLSVNYLITNRLSINEKYSIVRAKDILNDVFMVNIPADRLESTVKYSFKKYDSFVSIGNQLVAQQARVEDKSDFASPPPAYSIWRIDAGMKIQKISLGLSVSNAFNLAYREYLNRFRYFTNEMGRNVTLRLKYVF